MSLVIPPGYALAAWRFTLTGDPEEMVTTIGVSMAEYDGGQDAADSLYADFAAAFTAPFVLGGYTYQGTRVYVGQDGGSPIVFEKTAAIAGSNGGPPMPQNCAMLIHKFTGRGGRMGRGRMYTPPCLLGEDSISAIGMINPGSVAGLQAKVNAWLNPAGGNKVLLHEDSSPGSLVPDVITATTLDPMIATQRRRLRR